MGVVRLNDQELKLDEAKAKFVSSVAAANPMKVVQNSPFKSIGIVLFAGILAGFSGKKISKTLFPGTNLVAEILKKMF